MTADVVACRTVEDSSPSAELQNLVAPTRTDTFHHVGLLTKENKKEEDYTSPDVDQGVREAPGAGPLWIGLGTRRGRD